MAFSYFESIGSSNVFKKHTFRGAATQRKFGCAFSGSVAAKIMERLGYKEGSGLGKNQQGMSMALQVEKTSKRGGKILHEKDLLKCESPIQMILLFQTCCF